MTSLYRTVALKEMYDVAVVVTENLHFDVLGPVQEAFEENRAVAESILSLRSRATKRVFQVFLLPDNAHTTSTTAESGFDDDWEAVLVRESFRVFIFAYRTWCSWYNRYARLLRDYTRRDLVTQSIDGLPTRSNPHDASLFYLPGKAFVLAEEAVAGVNHLHTYWQIISMHSQLERVVSTNHALWRS